MTPAEDEDMIEALPTDGADPVLRDGVRPRGADGRLHSREAFGPQDLIEEPENLASRSRSSRCLSSRRPVIDRFRACWVTQAKSGRLFVPATWTRLVESSMKNRTYSVFRNTVSIVKKMACRGTCGGQIL